MHREVVTGDVDFLSTFRFTGIHTSQEAELAEMLHRATSEAALLEAWREVQENDLEDGKVNPQVAAYSDGILGRLAALSRALRAGTWEPSPAYAMEIEKRSGGKRLLAVPAVEDRIVERALMEVIDDMIDAVLLPWSYAYRKGLSVADALHDLAQARDDGARWVVRADVKDCFERIPRWSALTRLREVVPDAEVCHLVGRLVNRKGVGPAAHRMRQGRGLHQGSSLSPALTNLYLDSFDRDLLRAGFRVLRYSDDFAIPVATQVDGEKVLEIAQEAVRRLDLELNEDKSRIESFDEGVDFLGKITTARSGSRTTTYVSPLESTVYVTEPGSSLRAKGARLRVVRKNKPLLSVPFDRVRQVVCTTPATLTSPFLRRALEHGIDLVLAEEDGEFLGRLTGPYGPDVELRHAQHRLTDKRTAKLDLATAFVSGKISNMRTCLLRAARDGGGTGRRTSPDRPQVRAHGDQRSRAHGRGGCSEPRPLRRTRPDPRPDLVLHSLAPPSAARPGQRVAFLRVHAPDPRGGRCRGTGRAGPGRGLPARDAPRSPLPGPGPGRGVPPADRRPSRRRPVHQRPGQPDRLHHRHIGNNGLPHGP